MDELPIFGAGNEWEVADQSGLRQDSVRRAEDLHGLVLMSRLRLKVQCAEAPESTVPAATGSVEIAREVFFSTSESLKLATEHASMRSAEL